jgi:hypothetical protein
VSQATGAVVGVYESIKDAEAAVATLLAQVCRPSRCPWWAKTPLTPGEPAKFPPHRALAHPTTPAPTVKQPESHYGKEENHATQQDGSTD